MTSHQTVGRLVCPGYEHQGIPALYVHDLTGTEAADRLLSKPPPIHPATPDVLPKLRCWNPEIASALSEKDSAVKGIPFKLVTKYQTWAAPETNSFVAISYCWHNEEWEVPARFSHTPEGWSLPVSPAMLQALLCYTGDREAIWIDQLCIDQNDLKQKAHAIANMDTIYRNASRVAVLLEDLDIDPDVEQSLHLLARTLTEPENITNERMYVSRTATSQNFPSCLAQGTIDNLYDFSQQVFDDCKWFTRAWCCQEYQLNAARLFVFVGHKYKGIALTSHFFADFHENSETLNQDHALFTLPGFQTYSFGIGRNEPNEISHLNIFSLFAELSQLSCSYYNDIISIALNASGIFLRFDKIITTLSDCQFVLALISLSTGNPTVLDSVGPPLYRWPAPSHQGPLRWPINDDFRYSVDDWNLARLSPVSSIGRICPESITLDMFFLHSPPRLPTRESIDRVAACYMASRRGRSKQTDVAIVTIAAALDFGLSWTVQLMRHFLEETPVFVKHTRASSTSNSNDLVSIADSLIWSLIPRLEYIERTIPSIVPLSQDGSRFAIIFIPGRLEHGQFTFAVPAALNNATAGSLRRLWVLEKAKTSSSVFSIAGHGFYIGNRLEVDDEVSYAKDVIVVGRWNIDVDGYESAEEWAYEPENVPDLDIVWECDGTRS